MVIAILKETADNRVAIVPAVAAKLVKDGYQVAVESGAGESSFASDAAYAEAGAQVMERGALLAAADLLAAVQPPPLADLKRLRAGAVALAAFNPLGDPALAAELAALPLTVLSLDRIPRITIAQSMDILSSMASLAGYKAVLLAANLLPSYFPMLMTAAGTIPPAKVLVLGAGVAGLQAIATARRLGAKVEAFDVRSAVKQEVESLGAKFIEVEGAREERGAGGYAVEQTEEFQRRQRELIHERASKSNVIITTASIPGRRAPLLIEARSVEAMQPGSVIVDLAAATGGNCELTRNGETYRHGGVAIVGNSNLPAEMPADASRLFSNNVYNFLRYAFKDKQPVPDFANEIVAAMRIAAPAR